MTPDYALWNEALTEAFFGMDDAGETVYLAVDDDELEAIAREHGIETDDPGRSLAHAVRGELGHGGQRFAPFIRRLHRWRAEVEIPPQVALLSLFVLAASRMDAEPEKGLHANDYYSRLNPLLGLEQSAGMPDGFDQMERLWRDLGSWLDEDLEGARGRSAIHTHPHFTYIGYPLSQCALRARDRHRLPDFFRSVGLEPGDELSDERLLVHLRVWAQRPSCGLSNGGRASVLSAPSGMRAKAVVAIAQRELATWDGQLRDAEGRRRAELLLVVEVRGRKVRKIRLFAPCPDGFPGEAQWAASDGRTLELKSTGNGWYGEVPVQGLRALLNKGLTLSSGKFALSYDADTLVPLSKNFIPASGWVSQRRVTLFHEHMLLVASALSPVVDSFLKPHVEKGMAKEEDLKALGLPGWQAYFNVELKHIPPSDPPDGLERLVPRLNTTTRVEGGLRPARGIYLTGGEPDVYVTAGEGELCEVSVDGITSSFAEGACELRLSQSDLPPGKHQLQAAGRTIQFESIRGFGDIVPPHAGELAHLLERHAGYKPEGPIATEARATGPRRGEVAICGAHVSGAPDDLPLEVRPPLVLRAQFARYVVLGSRPGEVESFGSPGRPSWLSEELSFQFFEREFVFEPQLVILTGNAGKSVRVVASALSAPGTPTGEQRQINEWAEAIQHADAKQAQVEAAAKPVWLAYVALANELNQGVTA